MTARAAPTAHSDAQVSAAGSAVVAARLRRPSHHPSPPWCTARSTAIAASAAAHHSAAVSTRFRSTPSAAVNTNITPAGTTPYYFIPAPSRHPAMLALGMLLVIFGASQWINHAGWGAWVLLAGVAVWLTVLFQWFRQAIGESEGGLYSDRVDVSYRWSMSWFIFSEVMFFAAFFGALYWARVHALPMLGNLDHQLLWPDFKAIWPSAGGGITASPPGTVEPFERTALEAALKRVVGTRGVKVGDLVHAVRVAVTGKTVGPGLYDCLAILGRERSLARIERILPRCG